MAHKISFITPTSFIDVSVSSQKSERQCMCLLYAEYICLSGNCDKWAVCSRYPVSPTSKTNRHDITEIVIRQTIEKTEITIINLQF